MIELNNSFYPNKQSASPIPFGNAQKQDPEEIDMSHEAIPRKQTFDITTPFENSYTGEVLVAKSGSFVGLRSDTGYRSFDTLETKNGSVHITIKENYNSKGELTGYTLIKINEDGSEYGITSSKNYSDLFFTLMLSGSASYDRELECYVGSVSMPTMNKGVGYVWSVLFKAFTKLEGQTEYDVV